MPPSGHRAHKAAKQKKLSAKKDFKAIVRYQDGKHELLNIRFASDIDDARTVALESLCAVQALLIVV